MKVYKLQRISDKTFSTGGLHPSFTKTGKTWNKKSHLKNHLTLVDDHYARNKSFYAYSTPNPYTNKSNFQILEIEVFENFGNVTRIDFESL